MGERSRLRERALAAMTALLEQRADDGDGEPAVQLALPDSAEEAALMTHLSTQPVHVDELSRASGLAPSLVSSTLTLMELKGTVQQVGGMNYALTREPEPVYHISPEND